MNDLQQSKRVLEDKIALTKGNIERKKREFERLTKEAQETSEIIVTLNQELWKDEFALEAVNEEISQIPTIALNKTNPVWKDFSKPITIIILFLLPLLSHAQFHIDFG